MYGVRDGQAGATGRSEDAHDSPPKAAEDDHAPPVLVDDHAPSVLADDHAPPPTAPEDDHAPPVLVDDHAPPPPAPVVDALFHDSGSDFCGTDLYGVRDGQAGATGRSEDAHDPPPKAAEDDHAPAVLVDDHAPSFLVDDHAPPPTAPEDDHAPPVLVDDHAPPLPAPTVDALFHDSRSDFCGTDLYGVRDGQAGATGRSEDDHDSPPKAAEDDHAPPVLVDDHAPPPPTPAVDALFHDSDPDFCGTDLYGVRDGQAGATGRSEDAHDPPPAAPEDDHAPSVLVDDHAPPAAAPVELLPEVGLEVASSWPDFITFNQKALLFS